MPKPTKKVLIPHESFCSKHPNQALKPSKIFSKRLIIDLAFSQNGVRKTITSYTGIHGYCQICLKSYPPNLIKEIPKNMVYGYSYKALFVYLRISQQIPYGKISDCFVELFNDKMDWSYSINFIREFSNFNETTEQNIVQKLFSSPSIHADETSINIRGETQYVWIFTNGNQVILRLSESREAQTAHVFLKDYKGILISDFFAGYDNIDCPQQKCWVHFIRDLNNDLWSNPFDKEYEGFVLEIKNLIMPIIQTVHKKGLKKYFLSKYTKSVDKFYKNHVNEKIYKSELCKLYQKRFIRYKDSLFTFIEHDNINWHNNTAERGIRHVCKQRSISKFFHESLTPHYLRLVSIMQTCRFQNKSFLKFLLSKEKDIDNFGVRRKNVTEKD
jgi:Transposase IS66 family